MTEPYLIRAREIACNEIKPGPAFERGIMGGYCDGGTIIEDRIDAAKLDLLRTPEENIPDD